MLVVPTILFRPDTNEEGEVISNKVFLLLIPECSASSPMRPIGTSEVGLTHNTEPIGINLLLHTQIDN
jgi:hypothetical protein